MRLKLAKGQRGENGEEHEQEYIVKEDIWSEVHEWRMKDVVCATVFESPDPEAPGAGVGGGGEGGDGGLGGTERDGGEGDRVGDAQLDLAVAEAFLVLAPVGDGDGVGGTGPRRWRRLGTGMISGGKHERARVREIVLV